MAGIIIVALLHIVALACPWFAPYAPSEQGHVTEDRLLAPSLDHPLGTDRLSRDVLSRVLYASRVSLTIGTVSVAIAVAIGTAWGAVAGYAGGRVDAVMMRAVDMFMAFPSIVLLMTIAGLWREHSAWMIAVFIGLLSWMQLARLVRAQFVSLRERDFFRAARALGAGPWTLISRHLLPHTLSPIIVFATLRIGDMILLEAGLSYLGLSVDASTTPSWGNIIYDNKSAILTEWWIPFSAGFAIVLTVVGYNLLGDGLREAFDPRREQSGPERT